MEGWAQVDPKGPKGASRDAREPQGKAIPRRSGNFLPPLLSFTFYPRQNVTLNCIDQKIQGGERTTIALQLGITADEWTVFLTILDTVQNWVQTCTFNHPLRAVCLQKRFKTTFWLQEPMLKPPLNFKPTFSRSGPKRSLRRPLRGVGAENGHFRGLAPESF